MPDTQDWYYWENKIGQIMRSPYSGRRDDGIRGECSGIPACCISYFINVWKVDGNDSEVEHETGMEEAKEQGFEFQYIPCPDCLAERRFVKILSCDGPNCFCGQWEYREMVASSLDAIEPHVKKAYRKWRRKVRAGRKRRRGYA